MKYSGLSCLRILSVQNQVHIRRCFNIGYVCYPSYDRQLRIGANRTLYRNRYYPSGFFGSVYIAKISTLLTVGIVIRSIE